VRRWRTAPDPLDGADDEPIVDDEDDLLDGVTKGGGGLGCATGETDRRPDRRAHGPLARRGGAPSASRSLRLLQARCTALRQLVGGRLNQIERLFAGISTWPSKTRPFGQGGLHDRAEIPHAPARILHEQHPVKTFI
jgi:hypothetical protein